MIKRSFSALLLATCATALVRAQAPQAPATQPTPVTETAPTATMMAFELDPAESIRVDGHLDEPAWERAVPAAGFIQQDPDNGKPATERTEVRILYDRTKLYIGVFCFDDEPVTGLTSNTLQRDEPLGSGDRFMMSIDTYLDGRTGYFFEINPGGGMGDGLVIPGGGGSLGGGVNKQWDGVWTVKVLKSEIGWTAEYEIPFKTFNFDPHATAWGINFQRSVKRKNEESLWTGWARNQGLRRMSNAGRITGLKDLTQGLGIEFKPYVTGGLDAAPGRGLPDNQRTKDAGFDVFYNPTPGSRANLSINTDFAQTEADTRIVNLTRFPVSFPEKRDFFLEGSNFFDFAPRESGNTIQPFFSRRIGIDTSGQPQKIDVAEKFTGQFGADNIGVLQVRTAPGTKASELGDDFTVARYKHTFLKQSYVGGLYTRRDPRDVIGPALQTSGLDFALSTANFAGTSQNLDLSGFYIWTTNPLKTGRSNGYGLRLAYPNATWDAAMSFRTLQQNYNPATGFLLRAGFHEYSPSLGYTARPVSAPWIRTLTFSTSGSVQTDTANRVLTQSWTLTPLNLAWNTLDSVQVQILPNYERLDADFQISKGVTLPKGHEYRWTRYSAGLSTSDGRKVQFSLSGQVGGFYSGNRRQVSSSINLRPRSGLLFTLSRDWNGVNLPEGRFQTLLYNFTGRTQFNPFLSLVNTVQYDTVSRLVGWQSRFRWIIKPGSDFYFVYTRNWQDPLQTGFSTLDRQVQTKLNYTIRF